jgi:release factor glutamine methyltransferase
VAEGEVWTIGRVLSWAADDLRARGDDTPRLDAEVLLGFVLGVDRIGLIVDSARPLAKDELTRYRELHKRRRLGEPVAYLRGFREFYGRPFRVDARVLVPRPDTEVLVEVALARTVDRSLSTRVLDLCTGSGCVAITFAKERPNAYVLGTDVSEGAVAVARDNALRLGAVPWTWFRRSDLFADLGLARPRFDLVTANPPYIPEPEIATLAPTIKDFEPRIALSGGDDGLDLVRRIVREAPVHLAPGGVLAMEIGAGQAEAVAGLFEARGFVDVERTKDLAGIERVVSGVWRGDRP